MILHDLPVDAPTKLRKQVPAQKSGRARSAGDFSHIFENGFHNVGAHPPPEHLRSQHAAWEDALERARRLPLRLNDASVGAEAWRRSLREMPLLPVASLEEDLQYLLRARMVLTSLLHFYVHSLPPSSPSSPVKIPAPLAVPLLVVSHALDFPPVLAYADTEYYNYTWDSEVGDASEAARLPFRVLHTYSGTTDEAHFYTVALRIEGEGVQALRRMHEMLQLSSNAPGAPGSSDLPALLRGLAASIRNMDSILQTMRDGCEPPAFYNDVRPWFVGCTAEGSWVFEVDDTPETLEAVSGSEWVVRAEDGRCCAREMPGSSAAQSSIIQALDVFLGIEELTHERNFELERKNKEAAAAGNFLTRMRKYIPLAHRLFLESLREQAQGLREHLLGLKDGQEAIDAYNAAIAALRQFRTTHVRIATLYIVNQARHVADKKEVVTGEMRKEDKAKGTGGTDLVPFLKGIRDRTDQGTLDR
ncbi:Indoleamine 2,3-dioxygenase [Artomyces pyxidatus]|uniref:Indoleamine 2,3-dioxygenase n=1 Tax=Artomyces pyxidatus TaxID=48021 RepID=A0ACB8T6M0_9AGAM|nr:Indoleamine 2,3-dioxygenase [Artomyces pyxidatus]